MQVNTSIRINGKEFNLYDINQKLTFVKDSRCIVKIAKNEKSEREKFRSRTRFRFLFLILFCMFVSVDLDAAALRCYDMKEYCSSHSTHRRPNYIPNDLKPFIHLLPTQQVNTKCRCNFIYCPTCQSVPRYNRNWQCECTKGFTHGVGPDVQFPILRGWRSIFNQNGWHTNWTDCHAGTIYPGYFDYHSSFKSFNFFRSYFLHYAIVHQDCQCLWPEASDLASKISDTAYRLFKELLETTELSILAFDTTERSNFFLIEEAIVKNKELELPL